MQSWPFTVLYMDHTYDSIKGDFIFPQEHIMRYKQVTKTNDQPTDEKLFEELYTLNKKEPMGVAGQYSGNGSANQKNISSAIKKIEQEIKEGKVKPAEGNYMIEKKRKYRDGQLSICKFMDPAVMHELKNEFGLKQMLEQITPMQDKYFTLSKTLDKSLAKDLHPSIEEEHRIEQIINLPDFIQMSEEHKAKIWVFRYSL